MLRPALARKLLHPKVRDEARIGLEGDYGSLEGEVAASDSFRQVPDPARKPCLRAFQGEPPLSDEQCFLGIAPLAQGLGHGRKRQRLWVSSEESACEIVGEFAIGIVALRKVHKFCKVALMYSR
jgi:hypothetical protein